jgi:hypothetical protein
MAGQMPTTLIVVIWLLTVIGALFIGGFLKSYMSKKGENLATHEDIDKLVEEIRAVTTTTEEIKARISGDVWDRQKQWELKRDLLLDVVRRMDDLGDAVTKLHAVCMIDKKAQEKGVPRSLEARVAAGESFGENASAYDQAVSLVRLVCGDNVIKSLHEFGLMSRRLYQETTGEKPEAFLVKAKKYVEKQKSIIAEIRKELGVDKI